MTIVNFKFGVRILRYFRRNCRCFRKYDLQLKEKFPLYLYQEYKLCLREENYSINLQTNKNDNEDKDNVCPICCDQFQND